MEFIPCYNGNIMQNIPFIDTDKRDSKWFRLSATLEGRKTS